MRVKVHYSRLFLSEHREVERVPRMRLSLDEMAHSNTGSASVGFRILRRNSASCSPQLTSRRKQFFTERQTLCLPG